MSKLWGIILSTFIFTNSCLFAAAPTEHQMNKYDFFMQLVQHALVTGECNGYHNVPELVADIALTDMATTGISKYTGAKKYKWQTPLMAITGVILVKYLVSGFKQGIVYKSTLQKKYGKYKWPLALIAGIMIPQIVRAELTKATYNKLLKKTGFDRINYPQWILGSTILTLIAWQLEDTVSDLIGNVIGSVYEWVVPRTRVEQVVS